MPAPVPAGRGASPRRAHAERRLLPQPGRAGGIAPGPARWGCTGFGSPAARSRRGEEADGGWGAAQSLLRPRCRPSGRFEPFSIAVAGALRASYVFFCFALFFCLFVFLLSARWQRARRRPAGPARPPAVGRRRQGRPRAPRAGAAQGGWGRSRRLPAL